MGAPRGALGTPTTPETHNLCACDDSWASWTAPGPNGAPGECLECRGKPLERGRASRGLQTSLGAVPRPSGTFLGAKSQSGILVTNFPLENFKNDFSKMKPGCQRVSPRFPQPLGRPWDHSNAPSPPLASPPLMPPFTLTALHWCV